MSYKAVTILFIFFLTVTGTITGKSEPQAGNTVIIDRLNKQNIRGDISIAYVWGEQLAFPQRFVKGLFNLRNAMHKWTNLKVSFDEHIVLSSERLHTKPFVYVTTDDIFELTATERVNVRKYLENGGFMVLENAYPKNDFSLSEATLKKMIYDAVPNAHFVMIPNNHPLYHCFFDFDDGPPNGAELGSVGIFLAPQRFYLEGVWIGDRLVALYTNKGYIIKWSEAANNEPQLRMGVNMIVFALTQSGGIAKSR